MRLTLLALLTALLLNAPAHAQTIIADQAQKAFDLFAGGLSQPDYVGGKATKVLFSNVAGKWVSLNGPAPRTGVETYGADTEKFCKGNGVLTLATPDAYTLSVTAQPGEVEFRQSYLLIAGSTFAEHTDPLGYFASIGLGPDKVGPQFDQQRILALSQANGVVQIYRPSADILVFHREKAYPSVLARCPNP